MKHDVFISYSRKDSAIVKKFADELSKAGYSVWMDVDGIESGDEFKKKIAAAIRESMVFLFFSSAASNKSEWTVKEVNYAIKRKIQIIPIKLDNADYNESVDFDLCAVDFIQCAGLRGIQDAIGKLLRSLERKIGQRNRIVDEVKEEGRKLQKEQKEQSGDYAEKRGSIGDKIGVVFYLLLFSFGIYCIIVNNEAFWYIMTFSALSVVVTFWAELNQSSFMKKIGVCLNLLSIIFIIGGGLLFGIFDDWVDVLGFAIMGCVNLACSLFPLASMSCTDYDEGLEAYSKGEYENAVRLFRKAAEQGNANAQNYLGICYEKGSGVSKSETAAVKWYQKSAEQGNLYGQHNLGRCYHLGLGVAQSWAQASNWYQKSAKQGCQAAKDALESLGVEP